MTDLRAFGLALVDLIDVRDRALAERDAARDEAADLRADARVLRARVGQLEAGAADLRRRLADCEAAGSPVPPPSPDPDPTPDPGPDAPEEPPEAPEEPTDGPTERVWRPDPAAQSSRVVRDGNPHGAFARAGSVHVGKEAGADERPEVWESGLGLWAYLNTTGETQAEGTWAQATAVEVTNPRRGSVRATLTPGPRGIENRPELRSIEGQTRLRFQLPTAHGALTPEAPLPDGGPARLEIVEGDETETLRYHHTDPHTRDAHFIGEAFAAWVTPSTGLGEARRIDGEAFAPGTRVLPRFMAESYTLAPDITPGMEAAAARGDVIDLGSGLWRFSAAALPSCTIRMSGARCVFLFDGVDRDGITHRDAPRGTRTAPLAGPIAIEGTGEWIGPIGVAPEHGGQDPALIDGDHPRTAHGFHPVGVAGVRIEGDVAFRRWRNDGIVIDGQPWMEPVTPEATLDGNRIALTLGGEPIAVNTGVRRWTRGFAEDPMGVDKGKGPRLLVETPAGVLTSIDATRDQGNRAGLCYVHAPMRSREDAERRVGWLDNIEGVLELDFRPAWDPGDIRVTRCERIGIHTCSGVVLDGVRCLENVRNGITITSTAGAVPIPALTVLGNGTGATNGLGLEGDDAADAQLPSTSRSGYETNGTFDIGDLRVAGGRKRTGKLVKVGGEPGERRLFEGPVTIRRAHLGPTAGTALAVTEAGAHVVLHSPRIEGAEVAAKADHGARLDVIGVPEVTECRHAFVLTPRADPRSIVPT